MCVVLSPFAVSLVSLNYSLVSIATIWLGDCKCLSTLALLMIVLHINSSQIQSQSAFTFPRLEHSNFSHYW